MKMELTESSITATISYIQRISRIFMEIMTVFRNQRNTGGRDTKESYNIDVSGVNMQIWKRLSKFAVPELGDGDGHFTMRQ